MGKGRKNAALQSRVNAQLAAACAAGDLAAAAALSGLETPDLAKRFQDKIDQTESERAKGAQTILNNCASCAAPLPRLAKQCSRCKTRYCSATCQREHWERGGHDALCKKIKKGGGAEQYHADKKYKEAVTVAVEKYADDAEGQTCYICRDAVHQRTGEGLVRGCACHTTEGFAHVSCLAEEAKLLVAEAEENNFGVKEFIARWNRWQTCSLCGQNYHGVVKCALGWACWKTFVGRPESDLTRLDAMGNLGHGLLDVDDADAALQIFESSLAVTLSINPHDETHSLHCKHFIARCHQKTGRHEEAARLFRLVYAKRKAQKDTMNALYAGFHLARSLIELGRYADAKSLMLPLQRGLDSRVEQRPLMRRVYAEALYKTEGASRDEVFEAATILEDVLSLMRRRCGAGHPGTVETLTELDRARMTLEDKSKSQQ